MKVVIYAPCLEWPWYAYKPSPGERELEFSKKFRELKRKYKALFIPYPCPEVFLHGAIRPPMSKDLYLLMGIEKYCKTVVGFVKKVLSNLNGEVVFVGVSGSPTCGVFKTHITKKEFKEILSNLIKSGKIPEDIYENHDKYYDKVEGSGVLFDMLKKTFKNARFVELNRKDLESLRELEKALLET